ncbi:MAG: ATP-binding protein [Anaerolineaceae bacterium]|nr:ATP-binding protein [Anaerolineaceae bacterium]MCB9099220.1 ATP-binding protein [Anaerolineales bacterium]
MADTDFNDFDAFFPRAVTQKLGTVMSGSLSKGLEVKLDPSAPIEEMAVGRYVIVEGEQLKFFGMITDVALDNTNPQIEKTPPDVSDPFLREVYAGFSTFGRIHISPMLVLDQAAEEPRPVKTIPGHFSLVRAADEDDVNMVFGAEDEQHFHIGEPLDMENVHVNLDLVRMVERSVGIFGKSGTGKSFLTRLLLAGVIKRRAAVSLIFDMHNDYGWEVQSENRTPVKGLKQLFPQQVAIFTLDEASSRRRKVRPDFTVVLDWSDIQPEDLEMLRVTLDLSDQMIGAAYSLRRAWGRGWIKQLLEADKDAIDILVEGTTINRSSLDALSRRLERLTRFEFLRDSWKGDSAQKIIDYLDKGITVVLEFGRYGNSLEAYILVANYLTRRIHQMYVERVEQALGDAAQEPPQLMIVIEEAHKFLDPQIARQTIFGTIARELRKYNVTLLIVDQRPSGIDEEVMSQIGTRVTALLDNERDIAAVLTGVSGAGSLREVLARLDTKQQALIMGHAVPMPVVIQTRSYDADFYAAMGFQDEAALRAGRSTRVNLLRGQREEGID